MAEVIKGDAPAILNRLIAEKGLRKEYVAKQLGIRPSNLSDRLSGRVKFDADFAFKVSKVLGVDVKIFFNRKLFKMNKENKMTNPIKAFNFEGKQVIDSRDVAEMIGKQHAHLMRDIKRYINVLSTNPNLDSLNFFVESSYKDSKGEERPCYLLTKQGCEMVANKLTGDKGILFTAQYVSLFNQYEQEHQKLAKPQFEIPQTLGEALQLAADQQKLIEKNQPKVDYYDEQMRNPGLMTMTEIAKDFGMSAVTLNKILAEKKVQFRQGKHWVIAQKYAGKGYAAYEPYAYKKQTSKGMEKGVHNNLKLTQKGRKFIYDLLAEDGIHPIIENMSLLED